jgi:hypothetical protein
VPDIAILPALVQVNAPVGIKVIRPPPDAIGVGAVIVTTAVVPLINTIDVVGAIVVAEAIVGAAAVVAIKPECVILAETVVPVKVGDADKTTLPVPVEAVTPVPPLATGRVPVTPVVKGRPVQVVKVPDVGVPNIGVVKVGDVKVAVAKVGLVANTKAPLPVSPVTADAKFALEGVAKKVATLAPNPDTPVETGSPVQLDKVPDCGVPKIGVTNVELVNRLVTDSCLVVLVVFCTIGNTSAPACTVATGNAEMAIFGIIYFLLIVACKNVKSLTSTNNTIW